MTPKDKTIVPRVRDARKAAVLKAVREYWKRNKIPCTFSEIADMSGQSRSTAYNAVRELAANGFLLYDKHISRSVRPKGRS